MLENLVYADHCTWVNGQLAISGSGVSYMWIMT